LPENNQAYIGVDIGGTNLRGALVLADGSIVSRFRAESAIAKGADSFLLRLEQHLLEMLQYGAARGIKVAGIGMGIPGLINKVGKVSSSINMQPLNGLGVAEIIQQRLGIPTKNGNDANMIALGEATFGAGRGMRSLMVITIGTGLGSGLVLDGTLWTGSDGYAAEFGHFTLLPDGLPCPCGNRGCLEQYVSSSALSRYGGGVPPEELGIAADNGDEVALKAFRQLGASLGTGLAGLLNLLNLDGIIIGGGVAGSFRHFEQAMLDTIKERTFPAIAEKVILRQSALGDDAGLLGSALLIADHLNKTKG